MKKPNLMKLAIVANENAWKWRENIIIVENDGEKPMTENERNSETAY